MTKNIFRTVMMALIALTMLAGSALAENLPLYAEFEGNVSLLDLYGTPVKNILYAYSFEISDVKISGDLGDNNFDGASLSLNMPFRFRGGEGLEWKDSVYSGDGDDVLIGERSFFDPYKYEEKSELGTIGGFTFYVDQIGSFDDPADEYRGGYFTYNYDGSGSSAVDLFLLGSVYSGDQPLVYAEYQIRIITDAQGNSELDYFGVWDYNNVPDAPEPGTLVLLGTGLIGAAVMARRKIKK